MWWTRKTLQFTLRKSNMCIEGYAAGLFDGEGCVHISPHTPGTARHHQLIVIFSMTNPEPLNVLATHYGGWPKKQKRATTAGNPIYQWSISGPVAYNFLSSVRVWSFLKRNQIEIALQWPTFGGWGRGPRTKNGGKVPQDIIDTRERLRIELVTAKRKR
jgi:hypothetical protein